MTEKALELRDTSSHGAASRFSEFVRDLTDTRPALAVLIAIAIVAMVVCGLGWSFEHFHLM